MLLLKILQWGLMARFGSSPVSLGRLQGHSGLPSASVSPESASWILTNVPPPACTLSLPFWLQQCLQIFALLFPLPGITLFLPHTTPLTSPPSLTKFLLIYHLSWALPSPGGVCCLAKSCPLLPRQPHPILTLRQFCVWLSAIFSHQTRISLKARRVSRLLLILPSHGAVVPELKNERICV